MHNETGKHQLGIPQKAEPRLGYWGLQIKDSSTARILKIFSLILIVLRPLEKVKTIIFGVSYRKFL
jgi:hypothetical protein